MTVQFVEIEGSRIAMLPARDYERLLELAEDRADAAAAEKAERRRHDGEEYFPIEFVDRLLNGENRLHVWRQYQQLTLDRLGELAEVGKSTLSELERGKRLGKPAVWRRLAAALNADLDDIMPENEAS